MSRFLKRQAERAVQRLDVDRACPGWRKRTYSVFLSNHRVGNPVHIYLLRWSLIAFAYLTMSRRKRSGLMNSIILAYLPLLSV